MLKLVTNAFASTEIYDLLFSWTDDSVSLTQMIFFTIFPEILSSKNTLSKKLQMLDGQFKYNK